MFMERLLVILHVYYHDQVDYFIDKLGNISGVDWDLLVTYSSYSRETEDKIKAFRPDARMMQVDNIGYDIWPFIYAVKNVDMSGYGHIMKLHTKNYNEKANRINGIRLRRYHWRNLLVDSMLKNKEQFRKCMSMLREKHVGLVCAYELYKKVSEGLPEDLSMLRTEAIRLGVKKKWEHFCAGTMFLSRPDAFNLLREGDIDPHKWDSPLTHSCGSLAHAYERILSFAVLDSGYEVRLVHTYLTDTLKVCFHNIVGPALAFLLSIDRIGEKREKFLTLFGIRIRLAG